MKVSTMFWVALVVTSGVASIGCAENPADTRPSAMVQSSSNSEAVKLNASEPLSLGGDIIFVGSKVTGNHACKFTDWQGAAIPNGSKVEQMTLSFTVNMAGILADYESPNAWSKKLEGHLKSDDFFGVEKYPTSTFVSTKISKGSQGGASYNVTGLMTIKGVQKLISFPATISYSGDKLSLRTEFSINRKEFNIEYAGKPDDLIRDDVLLKLSFNN